MGDTQNCTQIVNLKNQIKCLKERLIKKNEELDQAKRIIKTLQSETERLKRVSSSGAGLKGNVGSYYGSLTHFPVEKSKHFPFKSA